MKYEYDYAVFIGRFQPYHPGHHSVALQALQKAERLIFLLGSNDASISVRNPFTSGQRRRMILAGFSETPDLIQRLRFAVQADHTYNEDRWIASIQSTVSSVIHADGWRAGPTKVALVGFQKDHTSYYLTRFPQWERIEVDPVPLMNSTDFRHQLFQPFNISDKWWISEPHRKEVEYFVDAIYNQIAGEFEHIRQYKRAWEAAPYPPTFVTVDAVVVQSGHILLVQRKAAPGEGLWALPGGFIDQNERLIEAVIRELREETKLAVPEKVLLGSMIKQNVYDDPERSARGRTITHAFLFKLADLADLPKVKGSDDAKNAKWFTLEAFQQMRSEMFEDHYSIVEHMMGI